jgi:hypothetical protein
MYKFKRLFAFAMIVALLATFALPAAAAKGPVFPGNPPLQSLTLRLPAGKVVVVKAGPARITFVSRPDGDKHLLPAGPWTFEGGNTRKWNMIVVDTATKVIVAASWIPGKIAFTQYEAMDVPDGNDYTVLEEKIPSAWVDFAPVAPAAGELTLLVAEKDMFVSVRDQNGANTDFYLRQPRGVTKPISEDGPYVLSAKSLDKKDANGNVIEKAHGFNILVIDWATMQILDSSYYPGEPFTQFRADSVDTQTGAILLVMEQCLPSNMP